MAEITYARLLYDFSLWCTIVCLNKIVTSVKWLSIIFTLIFLLMCFIFVFISINCTLKFFKWPTSTELSIDIKSAPFPRFSFCNENRMKRSVVDSNGPYAEIATLMSQYEAIEQNITTADDYGLSTTTSRLQRMHRARLMLRLLMAKLSDADRFAAGYNFTELVTECTFAGKTCTSEDFSSFLHPAFGVCYTFLGDRIITRAGKHEGLRMLLTVNQDSPIHRVFDFLPSTDSASVWAIVYNDSDHPDFTKDGMRVGASTQSFIALSKSKYSRMEMPYGNCTNDNSSTTDYYGNHTFTLQLCQHTCLQKLAMERCGCVDPLYPKIDNQSFCTTAKHMLCLMTLTNDVSPANSTEGQTMCGCRSPCIESVFHKTITNSIFPSGDYKVATGTQEQRNVLLGLQNGGRSGPGSDFSDDYDSTTTTVTMFSTPTTGGESTTTTSAATGSGTSTSTSTTSTTSSKATTTTTQTSCKFEPPTEARNALSSSKRCRNENRYKVFNDDNLIAIQGYPCTSNKTCQTCVTFSVPPPASQFICSYSDYPSVCSNKSNTGYLKVNCSDFFLNFDFIPMLSPVPNFTWWNNTTPGSSQECSSVMDLTAKAKCLRDSVCNDVTGKNHNLPPSIDQAFLPTMMTSGPLCDKIASLLTKAAEDAAKVFYQAHNSGRRKRHVATPSTHVDVPGFGSCEHANKNFKGAQACIDWYTRNGLIIHVYFESLQVNSYTEGAVYNLVALVSDISGHAGLWLGMSVVSVVEVIGLLFMCIYRLFFGKKIRLFDDDKIVRLDNREQARGE